MSFVSYTNDLGPCSMDTDPSVQDLLTLNLFPNPEYTAPSASTTSHIPARSPFVCPLSFKEMSGTVPFIALRPCGCVFSDSSIRGIIPNLTKGKGIKAVPKEERDDKPDEAKPVVASSDNKTVACPNCGTSFDPSLSTSILPINPSRDIQDILLEDLLTARAAAKSSKKRKAAAVVSHADEAEGETITSTNGTVKAAKRDENGERKASFKSASPAPGTGSGRATPTANTLNRSVHQKLADQEVKRLKAQEGMSDAVKAMFKSKEPDQRGTGGAADFFGRTFTRVSSLWSTACDGQTLTRSVRCLNVLNHARFGIGTSHCIVSSMLYPLLYVCSASPPGHDCHTQGLSRWTVQCSSRCRSVIGTRGMQGTEMDGWSSILMVAKEGPEGLSDR